MVGDNVMMVAGDNGMGWLVMTQWWWVGDNVVVVVGDSLMVKDGDNMVVTVGDNLMAMIGDNLMVVVGDNLMAMVGDNLMAMVGDNLMAVVDNLMVVVGDNLMVVVGDHLMSMVGDNPMPTWIPTPYRAVTVALTGFSYTLGQILLAGIAYAVPHWRWLQLTVSLPFFVFFLFSWWLAESARWLVLAGKEEKAVQILQRVAKINGREEEGKKITVEFLKSNMKEELAALKSSYTISDLVRTPVIRHIFFCLSIVWFSISFSYYGLAMDLQNFGVSIYLIQVIFGAVDFPAKLVVTVSVSYIGRRVSLMVALALAGLVIIANIFVPSGGWDFFWGGRWGGLLSHSTHLGQTGLGFGSTMARVGGIVAPLVKMMEEYYPFLPPAVYGVAPIAAAVAAGFLPETLNRPLPDTIEEVENRWVWGPPGSHRETPEHFGISQKPTGHPKSQWEAPDYNGTPKIPTEPPIIPTGLPNPNRTPIFQWLI
uniref:Solute carrier family 22 member 6 n=1 Tax=Phasianus colchicus TaxID=9054 RepID=A0A669R2P8_PHACC